MLTRRITATKLENLEMIVPSVKFAAVAALFS